MYGRYSYHPNQHQNQQCKNPAGGLRPLACTAKHQVKPKQNARSTFYGASATKSKGRKERKNKKKSTWIHFDQADGQREREGIMKCHHWKYTAKVAGGNGFLIGCLTPRREGYEALLMPVGCPIIIHLSLEKIRSLHKDLFIRRGLIFLS